MATEDGKVVEAAEAEAKATSGCFLPFHLPRSLFLSIWPALLPPELLMAVAERAEHEATVVVGSSRRCLPSTFGPPEGEGRLERLEARALLVSFLLLKNLFPHLPAFGFLER